MNKEHTPEKEPATEKKVDPDPSAPYREEALHPKEPAKVEEKEKEEKDVKKK